MAAVVLIEATPWRPEDGTALTVRMAGGGVRGYTHRGYGDWLPGVVALPRFTAQIGFDVAQGGFTGGAIPTTGAIGFLPSDAATTAALAGLLWPGAAITVLSGDDASEAPDWTTELVGTVAGLTVRGNGVSITISDLSGDLAKPVLTDRFAGSGGAEGGSFAKDRIKRRSWGACFNVEGQLIDKANSIYEFGDPARPIQAFTAVKDRGRATDAIVTVGWAGSVPETFAALQAASAPAGGAAVAPSIACVKWWTQPSGPLTADLQGETAAGYASTAPAIAARLIAARSALAVNAEADVIARANFPCGIHVSDESETTAQALDRLLLRVSIIWVVEPDGRVRLSTIGFDNPVETLAAYDIEREASYRPVRELLLGYQRNYRQHSDGELSAVFQAADGSYADGTPIEDLRPAEPGANVTEGRTAAAVAGQGALATQNSVTYGTQVSGLPVALQPGQLWGGQYIVSVNTIYGNGVTVESLRPGEAGANVTQTNTAAAIAGQGALATQSSADWATQVTGAGRPEDGATNDRGDDTRNDNFSPAYYRANYLRRLRTEFKSSAAIGAPSGGYGTLESYASWADASGGPVWQRFTDGGGRRYIRYSTSEAAWGGWQPEYSGNRRPTFDADLLEADGGAVATLGNFRTSLGTSAAVAGQGALATLSFITDGQLGGYLANRLAGASVDPNYLSAERTAWATGSTVEAWKPQEPGANITETRTASAIAGQGALATLNTADWATRVTGTGRPEDYADVTATAQVTVIVVDIEIAADSAGTIAGGQLPRTVLPVVMRGANNIRTEAGTAYALSAISSNLAGHVSVSNVADATKGQITLAAGIGGSGSFVFTATISGVAYARTVTVTVRRAAPPTGGGGGGTKSASAELVGAAVTSTSFLEIVKFSGMSAASGETITAQLSADFYTTSNVSTLNRIIAKWQRSAAGAGSWTDIDASMVSSYASFNEFTLDATPGSISGTHTVSPGAGSYDVRLVMSKESGPDIYINSGFASVTIA